MSFARITGQQRAKAQVDAWFASGRLPHAILITGREGVGKRRLALALAKAILCRQEEAEGCDACGSCTKVDHLTHPNLHILLPLPTGSSRTGSDNEQFASLRETALEYLAGAGVGRAGSNIPKDHVRLLQREMSFAPTEADSRVAIIFEADCMLAAGANSLLKILEEPPRHAVFLLVSATADRLLPTVVSRCQRLPLRPLSAGEVREAALAQGATEARATLAARLSVSNRIRPGDVTDDEFETLRGLVERFIDSGLEGREDDYWALLEELGGRPDKRRMEGFLELCSAYLRDLLLIDLQRGERVANADRQSALDTWQTRVDFVGLDRVAHTLDEAFECLARNVSSQLLLADLWYQLRRSRTPSR